MPEVPNDLMKLSDIVELYPPSRTWWDTQIARGRVTAYKVPPERGLFLSKADVERVLEPHPYVKQGSDESAG